MRGKAAHWLDGAADVLEDGEGPLVAPHQPQPNQRGLHAPSMASLGKHPLARCLGES